MHLYQISAGMHVKTAALNRKGEGEINILQSTRHSGKVGPG